ncbi:MAG: PulJ/GspJ family protein, partial [Planctomycetota bacterium]
RGFTLMELMIVIALFAGVTAITTGLVVSLRRSEQISGAYVEDITSLRRVVRVVERDLRRGDAPDYRLERGVLYRDDAVVARRIAAFELRAEGALNVARISLAPRSEVPQAKRPTVTVRVRRRR